MKGKIFVDTNILIYAHDIDERKKHGIAALPIPCHPLKHEDL